MSAFSFTFWQNVFYCPSKTSDRYWVDFIILLDSILVLFSIHIFGGIVSAIVCNHCEPRVCFDRRWASNTQFSNQITRCCKERNVSKLWSSPARVHTKKGYSQIVHAATQRCVKGMYDWSMRMVYYHGNRSSTW